VFTKELQELGWTDGRNIRFEHRWSEGKRRRCTPTSAELVALAPDVILDYRRAGHGADALRRPAPYRSCFTVVPDPVGSGLVSRLFEAGWQCYRVYAVLSMV